MSGTPTSNIFLYYIGSRYTSSSDGFRGEKNIESVLPKEVPLVELLWTSDSDDPGPAAPEPVLDGLPGARAATWRRCVAGPGPFESFLAPLAGEEDKQKEEEGRILYLEPR